MQGARGFTLVELLVAMTVLALLTVLLFGGLRFGTRAWERSNAHVGATDDVRQVQDMLRLAVEQAYPYRGPKSGQPIAFAGDARSVRLLAPAPQALIGAGRAEIAFTASLRGGEWELVMQARPELSSGGESWERPLMRHLAAIHFSYFGSETEGTAPLWRDSWSSQKLMPRLVRIAVQFPPGDVRVWPDLVVAPRLLVDAECVYDAQNKGCRDHP